MWLPDEDTEDWDSARRWVERMFAAWVGSGICVFRDGSICWMSCDSGIRSCGFGKEDDVGGAPDVV